MSCWENNSDPNTDFSMLLFGRDSQFEKKKALLKRNGAKYLVTYSG